MISFLLWYLAILIVGWLAFPIGYRLLPGLSDRGYGLARVLGLLVWGFFFWLLASLHILNNNTGGVLVALALMAAGSLWMGRGKWLEMRDFLRRQRGMVLTVEGVFLIAFAAMAALRAANPDITGTEKPMELMFINSILRSPNFPPMDGWLSGYAISYYYFGYVLVSMLIRVTGVYSGVAFNLAMVRFERGCGVQCVVHPARAGIQANRRPRGIG